MLENCKVRAIHYRFANTDECLIEYCVLPTKRNTLRLVLALPSSALYFLLAILLVIPSSAGINKKLVVKPDTPDGNFLDLIGLETDFDKRVTLIEQFTTLRSEEHTSELQSHLNLVCRLLLEKKKTLVLTWSRHISSH